MNIKWLPLQSMKSNNELLLQSDRVTVHLFLNIFDKTIDIAFDTITFFGYIQLLASELNLNLIHFRNK